MSDDPHIELLKRRKLQSLKRRLLIEKVEAEKQGEEADAPSTPSPPPPQPTEVLRQVFVGRAWEVWNAAMAQYPQVTRELEGALIKLIKSGRLRNQITGEQLFWFFRRLGVRVRLNTKIRIYESGELKSIADKLRD
jgi:DNA-binding TFAR19-related protein (PDSD5 family)